MKIALGIRGQHRAALRAGTHWLVLFVASALIVAACSSAPAGDAGDPEILIIGASGPGGTYFIYGGALGAALTEGTGRLTNVQQTDGGRANVGLAHEGRIHIGPTNNVEAYEGFYEEGKNNIRALAPMFPSLYQLVVLEDSPVQSYSDITGLRVSPGAAGSSHDISFRQILEVFGYEPAEISNAGTSDAAGLLRDGLIDAVFFATAAPVPALGEVDVSRPLRVVPLQEEEMDAMISEYGFLGRGVIPAGAYRGVTEDTPTLSAWNIFIVNAELDEDLVYELTAAIFDHHQMFLDSHATATAMTPEAILEARVPIHPGAIRYYEENGINIPEELRP